MKSMKKSIFVMLTWCVEVLKKARILWKKRIDHNESFKGIGNRFYPDRHGVTSVFLVLILTTIIGVTFSFLTMSRTICGISVTDSVVRLAGRSVLSEYDRALKNRYSIFAFRGQPEEIQQKMKHYTQESISMHSWMTLPAYSVDTSEYCLANVDSFEKEISECVKYEIAEGIMKDSAEKDGGQKGTVLDLTPAERILKNKSVAKALPSGGVSGSGSIYTSLKESTGSFSEVFSSGSRKVLVNRYILQHFKNAQLQDGFKESFFKYEIEYILEGHLDDDKNRKAVRRHLLLVRNGINLVFLFTDPDKSAELLELSQALTPGPEALITQAVLAELWALAESENDMRLLEHGKTVSLRKTTDSWAISLESLISLKDVTSTVSSKKPEEESTEEVDYEKVRENVSKKAKKEIAKLKKNDVYIDTGCEEGYTYQGYLQILLYCMNKNKKYGRMMDLMQINIQGTEDAGFYIKEQNTGFSIKAETVGKTYMYEQRY